MKVRGKKMSYGITLGKVYDVIGIKIQGNKSYYWIIDDLHQDDDFYPIWHSDDYFLIIDNILNYEIMLNKDIQNQITYLIGTVFKQDYSGDDMYDALLRGDEMAKSDLREFLKKIN